MPLDDDAHHRGDDELNDELDDPGRRPVVSSPLRDLEDLDLRHGNAADFGVVADDDDVPLSTAEIAYIRRARAANTLRGYRSDWAEFSTWCADLGVQPLPAAPSTLSGYLVALAEAGASVGTLNRRRAAIKLKHTLAKQADPCAHPRVVAVWEGIRRKHARETVQSSALMPPLLLRVVDACPREKTWKDPKRAPKPNLAGARDRALLLVGFVGALRRSELVGLTLDRVRRYGDGLVISLPRSKTNQLGQTAELVILPRSRDVEFCPVAALERWLELAGIGSLPGSEESALEAGGHSPALEETGPSPDLEDELARDSSSPRVPVFQGVTKGNRASGRALHPESVNVLVQNAIRRAGRSPEGFSAHSLRAGFVTWAHLRGASDRAIAHQTRHRSMASLGQYVRVATAWQDNAATDLGL